MRYDIYVYVIRRLKVNEQKRTWSWVRRPSQLLNIFVLNSIVKFIQLQIFTSFSSALDFSNSLIFLTISTNFTVGQAESAAGIRNAFNSVKPINYV